MWPLASKRVRRTCGSDNHRRNGVFQHNPPEAVGRELYSGKARFPQSLYTTLSMKRCGRRSDGGLMLVGRAGRYLRPWNKGLLIGRKRPLNQSTSAPLAGNRTIVVRPG